MNASLAELMLLKWTVLLALGWVVHGVFRGRHPGWRLCLWRGMLCAVVLMPLMAFVSLPAFEIPVYPAKDFPKATPAVLPVAAKGSASPQIKAVGPIFQPAIPAASVVSGLPSSSRRSSERSISWGGLLASVWGLGALVAGLRLVGLQWQLNGLRREAHEADPVWNRRLWELQARLGVCRTVDVRVSDAIVSPFACGFRRPMILLPTKMAEGLCDEEATALLAHELAHFRRHDLFWSVAWRWVQAMVWFHPLAWRIPAVHNLACEQEADRLAAGQLAERDAYPQLLARLALRVLAAPAVETRLVLNGASQIAQRLRHLEKGGSGVWRWTHSMAGGGLAVFLFLLVTGCHFTQSHDTMAVSPANIEFKKVLVTVIDDDGRPIEGASIRPDGFRVKGIHGADAYSWNTQLFGPSEKVFTDAAGKAWLKYPVEGIPEEKEFTRSLIFSIYQPEFSTVRIQDYPVEGTSDPILMTRGIELKVSAYYGPDQQPVTELIPNLNGEGVRAEDWQKLDNGVYDYHKVSPGGHLIQLMGRLPSGEIVYSDTQAFTAEKGKVSQLSMEMKPGIRLEGQLDERVPRPIKNGRVMISVRPKEYPAMLVIDDYYDLDKTNGGRHFWHSYRPINEDGTFVFESIPPGELDVYALGDGFAAKSVGQLENRFSDRLRPNSGLAAPQVFPLVAPVTKIVVATEPTATLEFKATTRSGKPLEGVFAGLYPTVFRMPGLAGWQQDSCEAPYRQIPSLPDLVYSGKTDKNGMLVLHNIPAENHGVDISAQEYQVPLQDAKGWRNRYVRTTFSPGETNRLTIAMEPKGTDYIGTGR